jgi:hypothetical protein
VNDLERVPLSPFDGRLFCIPAVRDVDGRRRAMRMSNHTFVVPPMKGLS